jgi:hypothetical protein
MIGVSIGGLFPCSIGYLHAPQHSAVHPCPPPHVLGSGVVTLQYCFHCSMICNVVSIQEVVEVYRIFPLQLPVPSFRARLA